MSRTTRKPQWYSEHSEVSFINWELRYQRDYEYVSYRRNKTEREKERKAAETKYVAEVAANGGSNILGYRKSAWSNTEYPIYIRKDYVASHYRVKVPRSKEYFINKAKNKYKVLTRDGAMSETSNRSGFKKDSAKAVRNANKRFCVRVLKDEWDEIPQPNGHEGDYTAWTWW